VVETAERIEAKHAVLDAAERLLVEVGYAGITTRRLAKEAGVNHGLIHYYFGSMENVLAETLERYTDRLIDRQRAMYAVDVPFIEKWRAAVRYLDEDLQSGYQKVWLELQALAWNRPELKDRVARVNGEWRSVLTDAFCRAMKEYGLDLRPFTVDVLVSLVMTFNEGMILERHSGMFEGHGELLAAIDRWLSQLERRRKG